VDSERIARTFVELAGSLVDDLDVLDLLQVLVDRCVDLLDVGAANILYADEHDRLVTVASEESAQYLGLYQLQVDEGPSLDCFRSGTSVSAPVLAEARERWPQFARTAIDEGFGGTVAVPLRMRGHVVGILNLLGDHDGSMGKPALLPVTQAMADVTAIAILQAHLGRDREVLIEQLQTALNSRIVIEQGKGVLATRLDVEINEAFELLRRRARDERRPLAEFASEVVHSRSEEFWASFRRQ
jgi:GAF domain-containing protein